MCVDKMTRFCDFTRVYTIHASSKDLASTSGSQGEKAPFKGWVSVYSGQTLSRAQLFVCGYEYDFTTRVCWASTLCLSPFSLTQTPSGQSCWHGAGFETASLIVGRSRGLGAAVNAATAASPRLVYCKVFLITHPSLLPLSALCAGWASEAAPPVSLPQK